MTKTKEEKAEYNKAYYLKNKDKLQDRNKVYYDTHAGERKVHRAENREEILEREKQSRVRRKDKIQKYRDDHKEEMHAYYLANREKWQQANLSRKYGISYDDYRHLLDLQQGKCAICGTENPGTRQKYFCVDHDHSTGEIRGLLCRGCNLGIGHLQDSVEVINRAALYLRKQK